MSTFRKAVLIAIVMTLSFWISGCASAPSGGGGSGPLDMMTPEVVEGRDNVASTLYWSGTAVVGASLLGFLARAFFPIAPLAANVGAFFLGLVLIYAGDVWTNHKVWIVLAMVSLLIMYIASIWDNLNLSLRPPQFVSDWVSSLWERVSRWYRK